MLNAGIITDLRLQPEYTLIEAFTKPNGERVRAERYRADFSYIDDSGRLIVEDVKTEGTKTRVYLNKIKQLYDKYKIEVKEV